MSNRQELYSITAQLVASAALTVIAPNLATAASGFVAIAELWGLVRQKRLGSLDLAIKHAQSAAERALRSNTEFSDEDFLRARVLLENASGSINISAEAYVEAATRGIPEDLLVKDFLGTISIQPGDDAPRRLLEITLGVVVSVVSRHPAIQQGIDRSFQIQNAQSTLNIQNSTQNIQEDIGRIKSSLQEYVPVQTLVMIYEELGFKIDLKKKFHITKEEIIELFLDQADKRLRRNDIIAEIKDTVPGRIENLSKEIDFLMQQRRFKEADIKLNEQKTLEELLKARRIGREGDLHFIQGNFASAEQKYLHAANTLPKTYNNAVWWFQMMRALALQDQITTSGNFSLAGNPLDIFEHDVIPAIDPNTHPKDWAGVKINYGRALMELGEVTENVEWLHLSKRSLEHALDVFTLESAKYEHAIANLNLANTVSQIGVVTGNFDEFRTAIRLFLYSIKVLSDDPAYSHAVTTAFNDLGICILKSSFHRFNFAWLGKARCAFENALERFQENQAPSLLGMIHTNLGLVVTEQSQFKFGQLKCELVHEAISSFERALNGLSPETSGVQWARAQTGMAVAYDIKSQLAHSEDDTTASIHCNSNALKIFDPQNFPIQYSSINLRLGNSYLDLWGRHGDDDAIALSVYSFREVDFEELRVRNQYSWAMATGNHGLALFQCAAKEKKLVMASQGAKKLQQAVNMLNSMGKTEEAAPFASEIALAFIWCKNLEFEANKGLLS